MHAEKVLLRGSPVRRGRVRRLGVAAVLVLSLAAAGCSGSSDDASPTTTTRPDQVDAKAISEWMGEAVPTPEAAEAVLSAGRPRAAKSLPADDIAEVTIEDGTIVVRYEPEEIDPDSSLVELLAATGYADARSLLAHPAVPAVRIVVAADDATATVTMDQDDTVGVTWDLVEEGVDSDPAVFLCAATSFEVPEGTEEPAC